VCVYCLEIQVRAKEVANDRNTCEDHLLCSKELDNGSQCEKLAKNNSYYCEDHNFLICTGKKKGNLDCENPAFSKELPYCKQHLPQMKQPNNRNNSNNNRNCLAITSKGLPCKGNPLPSLQYCRNHIHLQIEEEDEIDEDKIEDVFIKSPNELSNSNIKEQKTERENEIISQKSTSKKDNSNSSAVEDSISCPICCEIFLDPRVLPCGHTYCYSCLSKLKTNNCPLCRVSFESVDELAVNFALKQMIPNKTNDDKGMDIFIFSVHYFFNHFNSFYYMITHN
jgi:hypothetical protein